VYTSRCLGRETLSQRQLPATNGREVVLVPKGSHQAARRPRLTSASAPILIPSTASRRRRRRHRRCCCGQGASRCSTWPGDDRVYWLCAAEKGAQWLSRRSCVLCNNCTWLCYYRRSVGEYEHIACFCLGSGLGLTFVMWNVIHVLCHH